MAVIDTLRQRGLQPVAQVGTAATRVDRSSTIVSGGAAQSLAPSNDGRGGFILQNQSTGDLWVNDLGGTAAASQPSIQIPAGSYWTMEDTGISPAALSIFGATTGQAFAAREW